MPQQQPGELPSHTAAAPWVAALGATVLIQVVASLALAALPTIGPLIMRDAGLPAETIGQVYSFGLLGTVLFLAFGTPILARLGPVRTLQLGTLVAALGTAALATAGVLPVALLTGALLVGFGSGPNVPAGTHILARTAPPAHRTLVISARQAGAPLGGMLAGVAVPPLAAALGWRAALLLVAGALVASALAVQPLRPALDVDRDPSRAVGLRALIAPANLTAPFAALGLHPLLIPLVVLCFSLSVLMGTLSALTVSFLVEARGLALAEAGAAFAAMQAAGFAGRLALGWLADRTGTATRDLLVQSFAASASIVMLVLLPAGSPPTLFLLLSGVVGFAALSWPGILNAEVARFAPPDRVAEATMGTVLVGFAGLVGGAAACSAVVWATGGWTIPLLAVAGQAAVFAVVLAPRLRAAWARS
ncbi:MFS transporter [Roseomonas harenae]|uniref:MFS transporter n=1 Tax=Muricoccus harenae TaxID=2692566 RepID=UPI0013313AAB|nr:MFS transporter [Roseomonas harenae]